MKHGVVVAVVVGLMGTVAGSLRAQAPRTDAYDITAATTLKGTVSAIVLPTAAPTFLLLSVPGQSDQSEEWAIEGDPANRLIAAGWRPRMGVPVAVGSMVEVVVHRVKTGVDPLTLVPTSEPALVTSARAGRLAYGTQLTPAGGKPLTFGGNK